MQREDLPKCPFTSSLVQGFLAWQEKLIETIAVGGACLMLLGVFSRGYFASAFRSLTWVLAEASGQINESNFQEEVSERCASAALGFTSRYRYLTLTGSIISIASHWDAIQVQLLALTCYAKQANGIWEITVWDSSLLVRSQNADSTYKVPKLSNLSMEGWLCRRGKFHQLIKLVVEHRPSAIYFFSVSKAKGQQKGMSVNSVSTCVPC